MKNVVSSTDAPKAIGTYSQAIDAGSTIYLSGQIPLDPKTMELVEGDMTVQVRRVFDNLAAVIAAAAGSLDDLVKLTVYLTDLKHFALVNEEMVRRFQAPYPARAVVEVKALPRGALIEIDGILVKPVR